MRQGKLLQLELKMLVHIVAMLTKLLTRFDPEQYRWENKILVVSSTRFFPDCAGKNSPVQTLVLSVPPW